MARGGKRTPADPAPVSGPGALSQRTDGGPTQAPASFPAQFQGQRQGLAELQAAAPMSGGSGGGASGVGPSSPLPPGVSPQGILGPSLRPTEPVDAGVKPRRVIPDNPDALIDAIYAVYPHPDIAALRRR